MLEQQSEELTFVVLFGSRARRDWLPESDYDVLIGLCGEDGKRLIERMGAFAPPPMLNADVFPYSRAEWQQMFRTYHPLMLEALADGVVLWDRGEFAAMRAQFQQWQREGQVQPWRSGWKIAFKADADSPDGRAEER